METDTKKYYNTSMERVFKKLSSHGEAELHDIDYYFHLSVEEQQAIAWKLKKRAYGSNDPDIRTYHKRM
jgi:hypothetical protein